MAYMRQSGLGDYQNTGNWSWEFYPPPYDFLAPPRTIAAPGVVLPEDALQPAYGLRRFLGRPSVGMGCGKSGGDCGCGCSGKSAPHVHSFSGVTSPGYPAPGFSGFRGFGDDTGDTSGDNPYLPIPAPAPVPAASSDLSAFASSMGSALSQSVSAGAAPVLQTLSTSTILGVPAWVWLAGGAVLYVWLFTGGKKYSRVSRAKKAARKKAARVGSGAKSAIGTFGFGRSYGRVIEKGKKAA
jgi:hypothetical protein